MRVESVVYDIELGNVFLIGKLSQKNIVVFCWMPVCLGWAAGHRNFSEEQGVRCRIRVCSVYTCDDTIQAAVKGI